MKKNLREVLVDPGYTDVAVMEEFTEDDRCRIFLQEEESASVYGVLQDYYEIFGEMEEFTS